MNLLCYQFQNDDKMLEMLEYAFRHENLIHNKNNVLSRYKEFIGVPRILQWRGSRCGPGQGVWVTSSPRSWSKIWN